MFQQLRRNSDSLARVTVEEPTQAEVPRQEKRRQRENKRQDLIDSSRQSKAYGEGRQSCDDKDFWY
jgi:hypothetical protein